LINIAQSQPDWAYSFQDETWWSRLSHPDLHSWVEQGQFTKLIEQTHSKEDPEPKALACYGLLYVGKIPKPKAKRKSGCGLWKEIHAAT